MPGPNKKSASVDRMYLIDGADWNPEREGYVSLPGGNLVPAPDHEKYENEGKKHINF
jgi:hypothetical protein